MSINSKRQFLMSFAINADYEIVDFILNKIQKNTLFEKSECVF